MLSFDLALAVYIGSSSYGSFHFILPRAVLVKSLPTRRNKRLLPSTLAAEQANTMNLSDTVLFLSTKWRGSPPPAVLLHADV